jgi:hypothetical protein
MNIPFVEEIKKTFCKGCQNGGCCTNCETINCWLRTTYLPKGIWEEAAIQDVENNMVDNLTDAINREIVKHITIK